MDYHKSEHPLILREYGRNVQRMTEHLLTITDPEKRTAMANEVVRVMATLAPNAKEVAEYKKKLWDHLYLITGDSLEVTGPYPKPDVREVEAVKPRASYYSHSSRFRQYGKNVELMIARAMDMEAGQVRELYVKQIATYMKLLLATRSGSAGAQNADNQNYDAIVFEHLAQLSGGAIRLNTETTQLTSQFQSLQRLGITNNSQPVYARRPRKVLVKKRSVLPATNVNPSSNTAQPQGQNKARRNKNFRNRQGGGYPNRNNY